MTHRSRENDRRLFHFPATGSPATAAALLLAIDQRSWPVRENLALFFTKPRIESKPVFGPSAPSDNRATHLYGTVLHDGGRFRIWYTGMHSVSTPDHLVRGPVCYAESSDGKNWTRPDLGQVDWPHLGANNFLALSPDPLEPSAVVSVIRDDDDPDPARRYKLVWQMNGDTGIGTAVSADGIRWTRRPNTATGNLVIEFSSLYQHGGFYCVSGHLMYVARGEGDRPEGRQAYTLISTDFEHWIPGAIASFKTAEPLERTGFGRDDGKGLYTQVHVGVGAVSRGNVAIGFYGMWHHRQPHWGEGGINCDLGLVLSHDGLHFEEVVKGLPYIRSTESPADPVPDRQYPTVLCQNNSIVNLGAETLIYHGRWRNAGSESPVTKEPGMQTWRSKDYWAGVGLARLPRDRWGALALSGDCGTGAVWTTPVILAEDCRLQLNASDLQGLRVDVADERFALLPGWNDGKAAQDHSDALDAPVRWGDRRLSELAGQTVRFCVRFTRSDHTNPKLYALNLLRDA